MLMNKSSWLIYSRVPIWIQECQLQSLFQVLSYIDYNYCKKSVMLNLNDCGL